MSSAQEERLRFIDFRLMFLGDVSRQDLTDRFGISEPAATRDLTQYRERCAANMEYSHVQRAYLRNYNFAPLYDHESTEALAMIAHGHLALPRRERKPLLRCDLPIQLDSPDSMVVSTITRAINHQHARIARPRRARRAARGTGTRCASGRRRPRPARARRQPARAA